jgi:O-antigen biosynthesis protein WbqV
MPFDFTRLRRSYVVYAHDILMAGASFVLALYLRLGAEAVGVSSRELVVEGTILFTITCAAVFWFMGLYKGVWRYASTNDLVSIARSATLAVLIFLGAMFIWARLEDLPRSVPLIAWFVLIMLLGGPRFIYRMFKDRGLDFAGVPEGHRLVPVLLVGSDGAALFIRSLAHSGGDVYRVVGIVSDQERRIGQQIHGVDVLGTIDDIPAAVQRLAARGDRPERMILTREMDGARVRRLLDVASETGMTLGRMPKLTDFKEGATDRVEVRPVAIEDLLGRPQTALDRFAMRALIEGRRVMITGAGGSIGGELVRQISDFGPAAVALVDYSEFNLYTIERELGERHPDCKRIAVMADVRDARRVREVVADFKPELLFHAAAFKHVPLVEANPLEGLCTNVMGTVHVADACRENGVQVMVMISTDKAVNPTSVMGASKRIAERYCQSLDARPEVGTRYVTVRFGNVLGSTGSVVPLFQRQLALGGPLTVTHPDMTRYFMTVGEAVQLILQASALGHADRENAGKIFVLDMGEPVKILDLARQMIRLAGRQPDKDIKIEFVGIRPGEKLFEELLHTAEPPVPTRCQGILLAAPRGADNDPEALPQALSALEKACAKGDEAEALRVMRHLVPEFKDTPGA